MRRDIFFKLAFFSTLLTAVLVFTSNIEKPLFRSSLRGYSTIVVPERANLEKIKKLIKAGKLSGREAMFYRRIEHLP